MTQSKEQALTALITSPTIREASRKCGVAELTINEYLRTDEEFRPAYEQHRQAIIRDASEKMTNALTNAVSTLSEIMNDKESNTATRVTASKAVLEYGLKLWEVTDINARLTAIEEKISK